MQELNKPQSSLQAMLGDIPRANQPPDIGVSLKLLQAQENAVPVPDAPAASELWPERLSTYLAQMSFFFTERRHWPDLTLLTKRAEIEEKLGQGVQYTFHFVRCQSGGNLLWPMPPSQESQPSVESMFRNAQMLSLSDRYKLAKLLFDQVRTLTTTTDVSSALRLVQIPQADTRKKSERRALEDSGPNLRVREMRWLSEHRNEFVGQWVVIEGDQLISSGTNAQEVYQEARRLGVAVPFLIQVQPEDQLPFGGW